MKEEQKTNNNNNKKKKKAFFWSKFKLDNKQLTLINLDFAYLE